MRYVAAVETTVAWLHVSGDTLSGALVSGWTCSANTPDGRAWPATQSRIGWARFNSSSVCALAMYQSAKEGFRAGKQIPFERLMKDYYQIRGWDDNGIPAAATLQRLGL